MLLLPLIPPMYTNPQIENKKNNECVDERKNVSLLSPPGIKFKKIIVINDITKYINHIYRLNLYRNDK